MRTGYFNTSKGVGCPQPLRSFQANEQRYCRRNVQGCTSVYFNSYGHKYTEVCGMVEAYQYGSTDAFSGSSASLTINDRYIYGGISISHGRSSRSHLWTYAVGLNANPTDSRYRESNCPCTSLGTTATLPNFIQNDYYCDSGNPSGNRYSERHLYPDQLWDSSCALGSTCCDNPDQPWFKKKLGKTISDDVEMRWCQHDGWQEATATRSVEMYIRVA